MPATERFTMAPAPRMIAFPDATTGLVVRSYVSGEQARRQAVAAVEARNLVVKAAGKVPVKGNQGLGSDIFHPHRTALGQAVSLGQDHYELFFIEQLAVQGLLVERRTQETDIDLPCIQGKDVSTLDLNSGTAFVKFKHSRTNNVSQTGGDSDSDGSSLAQLSLPSCFNRVACLRN